MIGPLLDGVREKKPVVHCITNYVTANDCANILLALGASPVMADYIEDVAEITPRCDALCINLGTLNKERLSAMVCAAEAASRAGIPVVLDPAGAGASRFRLEAARLLLSKTGFSAIRANAAEIKALCGGSRDAAGVDADGAAVSGAEMRGYCARLAKMTGAAVIMTGENDLICAGERFFRVFGGSPLMARVTGTGCMLSAVTAAFLGTGADCGEACLAAAGLMAVCGAAAEARLGADEGTMTFRNLLTDGVFAADADKLERGVKYETGDITAVCGD